MTVMLIAGGRAQARAQDVAWPELAQVAETTLDQLVAAEYSPVIARFNEKMRAVATEDFLRQTMASLTAQLGALKTRTGTRTEEQNGIRLVIIGCEFERARVDAQMAFDVQGRITGLAFRPHAAPGAVYTTPPYVTSAAFREEDVTVDAGGWPLPGTLSIPAGAGPFPVMVLVHGWTTLRSGRRCSARARIGIEPPVHARHGQEHGRRVHAAITR